MATASTPDRLPELEIDHSSKIARDFRDLILEQGFTDINAYMLEMLQRDAGRKYKERLQGFASRMFPDGPPDRGERA